MAFVTAREIQEAPLELRQRMAALAARSAPEKTGKDEPIPWDSPVPFGDYDLPNFPVGALPDWLRCFVEDEAEATQTPPDLAGMLALAVCAAAVAKKVEVLVRLGWQEPLNLFVAVALPPGNRKSAVFSDMTAPLQSYEREQAEAQAAEIARATNERKVLEGRLARLQGEAARAKSSDAEILLRESSEVAAKLERFKVPARPRLLADDCSPERLASLLAEQGGRLAVMAPEGDVFDLMAGRYGNGPNFGVFLRGHAGDDLRVDRACRRCGPDCWHSASGFERGPAGPLGRGNRRRGDGGGRSVGGLPDCPCQGRLCRNGRRPHL